MYIAAGGYLSFPFFRLFPFLLFVGCQSGGHHFVHQMDNDLFGSFLTFSYFCGINQNIYDYEEDFFIARRCSPDGRHDHR